MDREMKQHIIAEAVSFPDLRPPAGYQELFRQKTEHRTYIFYGDGQGNYLYDSAEGLAFKAKTEEIKRKHRMKRWDFKGGQVAPVQQKGEQHETSEEMAGIG